MKRYVAILMALLMIAVLLTACSSSGPAADKGDKKEEVKVDEAKKADKDIVIGMIPYYRKDDFYKDLETGAFAQAKELGVTLDYQDPDTDQAKCMQIFEDFVTKGVDAIAMAPIGAEAHLPQVKDAKEKGIPVVTFDGKIEEDTDEPLVACALQFDFAKCGTALGKLIEEYVNENKYWDGSTKLKTVIIDFPKSAVVGVPIIDNCKKYLEEKGIIDVVAQQDGQADRNYAMGVMENIITAQGGDIDLLIGFNYDACMGGVEAARARNVKLIAFSQLWGEEAFQQLENDDPEYKGGVAYSPVDFGRYAVLNAYKLVTGEEVEKVKVLEPMLLTHKNIGEFDWRPIIEARGK